MQDYYLMLGVEHNASQAEIDKAYKDLMRFIHPNFWQNSPEMKEKAEERSKLLNEAYSVLKNPSKRAQYDREIQNHFASRKPFSNWEETRNEYTTPKRAEDESSKTGDQRKQTKYEGEGRANKDENRQWQQPHTAGRNSSEQKKTQITKVQNGFIALSGFLTWFGLLAFIPSLANGVILAIGGIIAFLAGGLFLAQKESRKNIGTVMVSAFLILYGLSTFGFTIPYLFMAMLALLAGILFVIQKGLHKNISIVLISAFLILFGLSIFGIAIPNILMGFLALGAASCIFIVR